MFLPNVINSTSLEAQFSAHPPPKCRLVVNVQVPVRIAEHQSQSHKSEQEKSQAYVDGEYSHPFRHIQYNRTASRRPIATLAMLLCRRIARCT